MKTRMNKRAASKRQAESLTCSVVPVETLRFGVKITGKTAPGSAFRAIFALLYNFAAHAKNFLKNRDKWSNRATLMTLQNR